MGGIALLMLYGNVYLVSNRSSS